MQNLMPPIDTTDHAFHDGDPTTGQLGTIVTAAWLNDVQGATRDIQAEIIAVLTKAGMQPNPQKKNQLAEAISQIIGSGGYATSGDLTLGLSKKIDKADIAQQLGNDTTKVPSLHLVATELGKKASIADANSKLAKDQNGADIQDKEKFIENLGLGEGSALPVGVPVPWPSATPPTGWIKCNGAAFSASQYPALARAYPALRLPDLRGEFIRGWDDGRGADAGRGILSYQSDAIRNIVGTTALGLQANSGFGWLPNVTSTGAMTYISNGGGRGVASEGTQGVTGNLGIKFDASLSVPTANENRPRNIAYNYIVRAA